jgi:hypothetical protein
MDRGGAKVNDNPFVRETGYADAGLVGPRGIRRAIIPLRKMILRLLRPFTLQLESELDSIARRQDQIGRRVQRTEAFGWDYVALVRRVTVLEDLVEELRTELEDRKAGAPVRATIPLRTTVDGDSHAHRSAGS